MPLWLSVPVVLALWIASWISGLDIATDNTDTYLLWTVTAIATGLLAVRLARSA